MSGDSKQVVTTNPTKENGNVISITETRTTSSSGRIIIKRIVKKKVVVTKPGPPAAYLTDPRKRIGRDYQNWREGSLIVTPVKKKKYKIARRIDDGHAGVVFRVINKKEQMFALKVPKKDTEKQFRKLHQEIEKNKQLAELGLPYAEIVEEGGDYLVKKWVEGIRGDEWFMSWNEQGRPLDDECWKKLIQLFDSLAARGIYVQNLKDLNMIWDGTKWVVIDVGYFKYNITPQEALGRFYETFDMRWNKPKYNRPRGPFRYFCPPIAEIRGQGPECYKKRPPELIAKKRAKMLARKQKAQQEAMEEQAVLNKLKEKEGQGVSKTSQPQLNGEEEPKEEDTEEKAGSESGEKTEEEVVKAVKKSFKGEKKEDSEGEGSEREKSNKKTKKKKTKKEKGMKKKKKASTSPRTAEGAGRVKRPKKKPEKKKNKKKTQSDV